MKQSYNFLWLIIALLVGACSNQPEVSGTPTATSVSSVEEVITGTISVPPTSTAQAPEKLVILTQRPLQTLEPYYLVGMHPAESVAAHLWDTLIWIKDDLSLAPMLAQKWTLVNDQTWEFELRQDVIFHNGETFNAQAVKFSLERANSLPDSLETFYTDAHVEAIEIVDDYTVRIHTVEPAPNLPYLISSIEMLPPIYYEQTPSAQLTTQPVGTGPYQIQQWTPGHPLTLEANPNYWQGEPFFTTLIFDNQANPADRLEVLQEGEAIVADLLSDQAAAVKAASANFLSVESTQRLFIGIRPDPETPLADKRVRQALNYAIDVEALVNEYGGGFGQRYGSWVLPPGADPDLTPWPYDLDQARKLLAEAGYADGFAVTLDTPRDHYYNDIAIAEAVAKQLAQIGVQVNVQTYTWESYVTTRLAPRQTAPLFLLALASRGDPLTDTENLSYTFPFNPTQWLNADFEETLAKAKNTFNEQGRLRLLHQAQKIAYEEAPWIWLVRPYDFYAVTPNLNWQPRPDGLIYLYYSLSSNVDLSGEDTQ